MFEWLAAEGSEPVVGRGEFGDAGWDCPWMELPLDGTHCAGQLSTPIKANCRVQGVWY